MRHPLFRLLIVLSVVSLLAPAGVRADKPSGGDAPDEAKTAPHDPAPGAADARARHPWGRLKPGSWVQSKTTMKNEVENPSGGAIPATEFVTESKTTLKEVRDASVVLAMESTTAGMSQTMETEVFFDAAPAGSEPPKILEEKDEEVKAAGESWACHYKKTEGQGMQGTETTETWMCDKAPGGVVKRITSSDQAGQKVTSLLTLEKKEETVEIAGKKLKCWVMKNTTDSPPNNTSTMTLWYSDEVPGLTVKSQGISKASASKTETKMEVTGFEVKN